jgi:hypothetical protein
MIRALVASTLLWLLLSCGGTGAKPCNANTCSTGCCDANDQCQPGNTTMSCGEFGLTCRACSIGQACSLGACTFLGTGGGTAAGGGTTNGGGTGFGGGTTSGGGTGFGGGTTSGGGTGFGGGGSPSGGGTGLGGGTGTCSAKALAVPTSASINGTTDTGGASAGTSSCGGGLTEQIYTFTLTATHTVTATVSAQTSTFEPVLSFRSTCLGSELTCSAGTALGGTATLTSSLAAGTYYLWVDSYNDGAGSTAGAYLLSVAVQ